MYLTRPEDDQRIYHDGPFQLDRARSYPQRATHKPNGLWFSIQGDWDRWARTDSPGYTNGTLMHRVDIRPFDALLTITTADELDAFTRQYTPRRVSTVWADDPWQIDWPLVAVKHPGIAIFPYIWERRLSHASWYYSWDCASGCVWDLDVVRSVIPIGTVVHPEREDDWQW